MEKEKKINLKCWMNWAVAATTEKAAAAAKNCDRTESYVEQCLHNSRLILTEKKKQKIRYRYRGAEQQSVMQKY